MDTRIRVTVSQGSVKHVKKGRKYLELCLQIASIFLARAVP